MSVLPSGKKVARLSPEPGSVRRRNVQGSSRASAAPLALTGEPRPNSWVEATALAAARKCRRSIVFSSTHLS